MAIFGLLSALSAQVLQFQSAPIPLNRESVRGTGTGAITTFPQFQPENCSHRPAQWKHLVGTFVIGDGKERKVVREAWIKIDPCERQGIAAVLCPRRESAVASYETFRSEIRFVTVVQAVTVTDEDGISPKCEFNRRIKWRVHEW